MKFLIAVSNFIRGELIMLGSLVQVTIALVCAFGVTLSAEQISTIEAFAAVAFAILARYNVTPTFRIPASETPPSPQPGAP